MAERITLAYEFPGIAEKFLGWRDKIVETLDSYGIHIPLPAPIEVAKVDILTSAGTGAFHFSDKTTKTPHTSNFSRTARLLKLELVQNLAPAVTKDEDVPTGEQIQSGQLELIAEVIHDRIEAEKSNQNKTWNPRVSPESLRRIDFNTLASITNLYVKNRAFWRESLAGYDPNDRPIKQSALSSLNTESDINL